MRAPDFNWAAFRKVIRRFDQVAAVLPRAIARTPARGCPVDAEWFQSAARDSQRGHDRILLYFHGGSYMLDLTPLHDTLAAQLALVADADVLAVDYRLAPEHPFPAGIDDGVAAYRYLLKSGRTADRIAFVGDSAGAGVALAALLRLRDMGSEMPAAYIALSPWAGLTFSDSSIIDNANVDPFMADTEFIAMCAELYLQGVAASQPLASPALADLTGMPPTLVHAGSTDLLLDDARTIVRGIRAAGGKARLDVWRNMPHVWQRLAAYIPEASESLTAAGQFLRHHIADRDIAQAG